MVTRRKIVFTLLTTVLFCLLMEVGFRIAYPLLGGDVEQIAAYRSFVVDREVTYYQPHPYTLFTFNSRAPGVGSLGFLGEELPPKEKPAGTLRIACLGGSTTACGNYEGYEGSYPYFLQQELAQALDRPVEVLNFGVNAWTTAESLVNFVLNVRDTSPDIVIVHHAANDGGPRLYPNYRSDFSHYRKGWDLPQKHWLDRALTAGSHLWAWLRSRDHFKTIDVTYAVTQPLAKGASQIRNGRFPEGTEYGFLRNVRTIIELERHDGGKTILATLPCDERGAAPDEGISLAVRENNALLRRLAREENVPLADLYAEMPVSNPRMADSLIDRIHFEPEGNRMKAEILARAILEQLESE